MRSQPAQGPPPALRAAPHRLSRQRGPGARQPGSSWSWAARPTRCGRRSSPETEAALRGAEGAPGHRPRGAAGARRLRRRPRHASWSCRATCRCSRTRRSSGSSAPPRADRRGGHPADRGRRRTPPATAAWCGSRAGRWRIVEHRDATDGPAADPRDRHQRVLLRRRAPLAARWPRSRPRTSRASTT